MRSMMRPGEQSSTTNASHAGFVWAIREFRHSKRNASCLKHGIAIVTRGSPDAAGRSSFIYCLKFGCHIRQSTLRGRVLEHAVSSITLYFYTSLTAVHENSGN